MFKTNDEIISIEAKATDPIPTGVVFWSHDKGTAKMMFRLKKENINQALSEGTIIPILLEFNSNTAESGRGRHIYHATIEDAINGIVSIILEKNILGYQGRVDGSIYIELPDKRSLDTAGRFSFEIKRSPIDEEVPELEDYYWQGFNEIMESYHQTIAGIKSEAKELLDSLKQDVSSAQEKVSQLEQSISTANTKLNARIDEISKKIDENDVFTKQESSANVIDQIGGAESAILKKELLVNGVEGTASRYVKDLSVYPNYAPKARFATKTVSLGSGDATIYWGSFGAEQMYLFNAYKNAKAVSVSCDVKVISKTGTGSIYLREQNGRWKALTEKLSLNDLVEGRTYRLQGTNDFSSDPIQSYSIGLAGWTDGSGTYEVSNLCINFGGIKIYFPACEDFGIVTGQPNLLNGTSNEWKNYAFSGWDSGAVTVALSDVGLKVGDTISLRAEIDNTLNSVRTYFKMHFNDGSNHLGELSTTRVDGGKSGISEGQGVIPENTVRLVVYYVGKPDNTTSIDVNVRRNKIIKGSLDAMDEWTPSQSDSGLTPVNNGMVHFTDDEYATLLSEDGVVRSETLMVGYGAKILVEFLVMETLEQKYPYMFEDLSTAADKISRYMAIVKKETIAINARGGGVSGSTESNYFRMYYLNPKQPTWYGSGSIFSTGNQFANKSEEISTWTRERCFNGSYVFSVVSNMEGNNDAGRISDGVIPSWIELKHIRLIVELEVNGRTIIEEIIAAYHGDNLATVEEATTGTDEMKLMTPSTTKQAIGKQGVLLSGDQEIAGEKKFLVTPTVNGKKMLTVDNLPMQAAIWSGAAFMSAAHTITLSKSINDCFSGIVLKFNPYNSNSSAPYTSQSSYVFIPKSHVQGNSSGQNVLCAIGKQDGTLVGFKVITVSPNKLTGADVNAVGALYGYVMTGVYEA